MFTPITDDTLIMDSHPLQIILGAGDQSYPGWVPTQREQLDLLEPRSFASYLGARKADAFLCEHVWEHFTESQGRAAASLCFDHLKHGGFIRVAVPDAWFRNESYQNLVKIGGPGPIDHPAADHKIVYTLPLLTDVFRAAGFSVDPLEYCDENGRFHYRDWDYSAGPIYRSFRSDARNRGFALGFVSLIIDAKKA